MKKLSNFKFDPDKCKHCQMEEKGMIPFLKDKEGKLHPKCLVCKEYYCSTEKILFGRHEQCYMDFAKKHNRMVRDSRKQVEKK